MRYANPFKKLSKSMVQVVAGAVTGRIFFPRKFQYMYMPPADYDVITKGYKLSLDLVWIGYTDRPDRARKLCKFRINRISFLVNWDLNISNLLQKRRSHQTLGSNRSISTFLKGHLKLLHFLLLSPEIFKNIFQLLLCFQPCQKAKSI
jgi:hypothetical protein